MSKKPKHEEQHETEDPKTEHPKHKVEFTGQSMGKPELIAAVQEAGQGYSKKDATASVNAVFKFIEDQLAIGNRVQIVGHGTYETVNRAERNGKNPQTKEPMVIPAKRVPHFKAGSTLKKAVEVK